jgi:hypothetical protein|tara:strand:- start:1782 stop:2189 length:408 start_codon:yes stop_codon:yes gene_type:complete
MVKQITLTLDTEFSCEYYENDILIKKTSNNKHHKFIVTQLPCNIKIKINPWKIRPLIRIDEHLVNYGLAKITPWDHMIELNLEKNYTDIYFKNIIQAKRDYLSKTEQNIPDNMESYVGVNNEYKELVGQIKELIK